MNRHGPISKPLSNNWKKRNKEVNRGALDESGPTVQGQCEEIRPQAGLEGPKAQLYICRSQPAGQPAGPRSQGTGPFQRR
ncbi:hypothetical protein DESC_800013 [Desulfosarcina cetonica]|nr:hypothetical protein DESC_800013 [Desulfosarcina cetonica]